MSIPYTDQPTVATTTAVAVEAPSSIAASRHAPPGLSLPARRQVRG
jgi:hypothetical protein